MTKRRRFVVVSGLALLSVSGGLVAASSPVQAASFPGQNGKIAFARDTGTPAVYVMNADGSKPKQIARSGSDAPAPQWSADGSKIVFVAVKKHGGEIFVVDANGKHLKRLTKNKVNDGAPTWSPDGTKIAYTSYGEDNIDIFVMNADGKNQIDLTNTPASTEDEATWSPDGTQIAFISHAENTGEDIAPFLVSVMSADGSGAHPLTTDGVAARPNWSPDGTKIAFEGQVEGIAKIFVMNADGSNPVNVTGPDGLGFSPWWSPDGTQILFATDRHESAFDSQIYVMNADGSNQTPLTDEDGVIDRAPSWQPVAD